jgi:hypothetical protein
LPADCTVNEETPDFALPTPDSFLLLRSCNTGSDVLQLVLIHWLSCSTTATQEANAFGFMAILGGGETVAKCGRLICVSHCMFDDALRRLWRRSVSLHERFRKRHHGERESRNLPSNSGFGICRRP